jgi:NADH:ubiquinone oxidoreductase subunit 11 or 4L (chain K)
MSPLYTYLTITTLLFGLSLAGLVVHRKNVILLLVSIELMLLSVNSNFIIFSRHYHDIAGQIMVFFVLTVAAAEAAIGLAIVMLVYRNRGTIDADQMTYLKG